MRCVFLQLLNIRLYWQASKEIGDLHSWQVDAEASELVADLQIRVKVSSCLRSLVQKTLLLY